MSNIDKQAYRADGSDIGTGRLREIADNPYGDEEKCWLAKRLLALLDELEAKDKLIAEMQALASGVKQFTEFQICHYGATEDYAKGYNRYEIAEQNGMSREFVDWYFDKKKAGCGNVWFMMMAAMWEGWQGCAAIQQAAENAVSRCTIQTAPTLDSLPKNAESCSSNSLVIPDGWVMLPAEPTQAMMNAWLSEVANWRGHAAGYRAMVAAAPLQEVKRCT